MIIVAEKDEKKMFLYYEISSSFLMNFMWPVFFQDLFAYYFSWKVKKKLKKFKSSHLYEELLNSDF